VKSGACINEYVFSDHTEAAFVTHIRNPCHFIVQLNRNIDRLTELSHAINHYCKTVAGQKEIPSRVDLGNGQLVPRLGKVNLVVLQSGTRYRRQ